MKKLEKWLEYIYIYIYIYISNQQIREEVQVIY